jgi:hypothetical protein
MICILAQHVNILKHISIILGKFVEAAYEWMAAQLR